MRRLLWIAIVLLSVAIRPVYAQGNLEQHYSNKDLGFSFDYPADWTVTLAGSAIIAGMPTDVQSLADDRIPAGLVLRIVGGDSDSFKLAPTDGLSEVLSVLGAVGEPTSFKLDQRNALRADLVNETGQRIAVQLPDQRWLILTGTCTAECWPNNVTTFNAILDSLSFEPDTTAPIVVHYGDKIQKNLTRGLESFLFAFSAQAGDLVTITMVADTGGHLDPALVLLGPDGKTVAQNDDSFDSQFGLTNARLTRFPIPIDGTYTIQAARGSDGNGRFTLSLKNTNAKSDAEIVTFGTSQSGEITNDVWQIRFQFQAAKGDVISIDVESASGSKLVPVVVLMNPRGDPVASSVVDPKTPRSAKIDGFEIKEDGLYTIEVSRANLEHGTSTGTFDLTVTRSAPGA